MASEEGVGQKELMRQERRGGEGVQSTEKLRAKSKNVNGRLTAELRVVTPNPSHSSMHRLIIFMVYVENTSRYSYSW